MEKNKKILIGLALGAVVFVAALGGGIVYLVFMATAPLGETADAFLGLVAQHKYQEAYDSTSSGFKEHATEQELETIAVQEHLDQYASSDWSSRNIENDQGTLNGTITLTNGNTVPLEVDLLQENGEWKVYGLTSQGGGMQQIPSSTSESDTSESDYIAPSDDESKQMAQEVLTTFAQSVKTNDFSALYSSASEQWQSQTSPSKLKEAFGGFVDSKLDFSGLSDLPVELTSPPTVNSKDRLVIEGAIADVPKKGQTFVFTVTFIPENDEWKPFGLDVSVKNK